jgi:hypothetical protein
MDNVPRDGASRSDHRWPDRESSARHHPEDVSLLKLAHIISRDQAFLAIGRDAALRYASSAEEALEPTPDHETAAYEPAEYHLPEYDQPEFDTDDRIVDARAEGSPQEPDGDPAHLDWDDRGARRGPTVRAQHFTANDDEFSRPPQLGHALSELARLVGRIDSFLAADSTRTGAFEQTPGGRPAARDGVDDDAVDDDETQDVEMPVPSRHDRLTNDTDDPGLSLYAPRRKRRAAFVIARTDQSENLYGEARRASEELPNAPRDRARSHAPRQSDRGDDYRARPQQQRRPPMGPAPRRRGRKLLTAVTVVAFTATAALYGYRTWADAGSSHPGPIAAEAAPATATGHSLDAAAVDTSTNSGVGPSTRGVWSDLTGLLAPGTTLNGAASASRMGAGDTAALAATGRPQRRDEDRAHRSPTARVGARVGNLVPIANAGVSASTNPVLPCEGGAARSSC